MKNAWPISNLSCLSVKLPLSLKARCSEVRRLPIRRDERGRVQQKTATRSVGWYVFTPVKLRQTLQWATCLNWATRTPRVTPRISSCVVNKKVLLPHIFHYIHRDIWHEDFILTKKCKNCLLGNQLFLWNMTTRSSFRNVAFRWLDPFTDSSTFFSTQWTSVGFQAPAATDARKLAYNVSIC